eukprot:m.100287 g.100287  ORF g.100287 m.100287 type:complete len:941 (+) comp13166_c1_seq1:96-2918(+)
MSAPRTRMQKRLQQFKHKNSAARARVEEAQKQRKQRRAANYNLSRNFDLLGQVSSVASQPEEKQTRKEKLRVWQQARDAAREAEKDKGKLKPFVAGSVRTHTASVGGQKPVLRSLESNPNLPPMTAHAKKKEDKKRHSTIRSLLQGKQKPLDQAHASQLQQLTVLEEQSEGAIAHIQVTEVDSLSASAFVTKTTSMKTDADATEQEQELADSTAQQDGDSTVSASSSGASKRSLAAEFASDEQNAGIMSNLLSQLAVMVPSVAREASSETTCNSGCELMHTPSRAAGDGIGRIVAGVGAAATTITMDMSGEAVSDLLMSEASEEADVEGTVDANRKKMYDAVDMINDLVERWQPEIAVAAEINGDAAEELRMAIGQAELLKAKKIASYAKLCDRAEAKTHNTTVDDITGYWSASIQLQLDDIKRRFKVCEEYQARKYLAEADAAGEEAIEPAAPKKKKKKAAARRTATSSGPRARRAGGAKSSARSFIAKMRAQQQQQQAKVSAPDSPAVAIAAPTSTTRASAMTPRRVRYANIEDSMTSSKRVGFASKLVDGESQEPMSVETEMGISMESETMVEPACETVLVAVKATKKQEEELGSEFYLTPVRRSTRKTPSKYRQPAPKQPSVASMLSATGYAFMPNDALAVRTSIKTPSPVAVEQGSKGLNKLFDEASFTPVTRSTATTSAMTPVRDTKKQGKEVGEEDHVEGHAVSPPSAATSGVGGAVSQTPVMMQSTGKRRPQVHTGLTSITRRLAAVSARTPGASAKRSSVRRDESKLLAFRKLGAATPLASQKRGEPQNLSALLFDEDESASDTSVVSTSQIFKSDRSTRGMSTLGFHGVDSTSPPRLNLDVTLSGNSAVDEDVDEEVDEDQPVSKPPTSVQPPARLISLTPLNASTPKTRSRLARVEMPQGLSAATATLLQSIPESPAHGSVRSDLSSLF